MIDSRKGSFSRHWWMVKTPWWTEERFGGCPEAIVPATALVSVATTGRHWPKNILDRGNLRFL